MIEELPDDIEQDELDDIEPVGDENQLYEHFRVVVDKGQAMVRVDKYLFERIFTPFSIIAYPSSMLRAIAYRKRLKTVLSWPMANR